MKKTAITFLLVCICFAICACKKPEKTQDSVAAPTANVDTAVASKDPVTSKEPVVSKMTETPIRPVDGNEFEALEVVDDNTLVLDSTISKILTNNTLSYKIESKPLSRENQKGELGVAYPQLIGADKNLQEVNKLIYKLVDKNVSKEDEMNPIIDSQFEYEIKKSSDELISIVFSGYNNARSAAHPENRVFTFNYDLKSNKLIELNQITTIDMDFLKKSKAALAKQVEEELFKGILETNGDLDTLMDELKGDTAAFYFEGNKIYIGFTLNAAGFYTTYVSFLYKQKTDGGMKDGMRKM